MKMCEQIFKKKTAPQYNWNSLNWKKNQEYRNIAPLSLQLRSYKKVYTTGQILEIRFLKS